MKTMTIMACALCASQVVAGAMPDGYVPLNYLRGTGQQYIDSRYNLTSKSRVDIDFTLYEKNDASALPFGASSDHDYDYYFLYISYSAKQWCPVVGSVWSYATAEQPPLLGVHRFTINDGGTNNLDGVLQQFACPGDFTAPHTAYIFARNDGGTAARICNMDLRAFDIYEDGELVRSFRPALRLSDNTQGLWESVKGDFHENAGNGSFSTPTPLNFIRVAGIPENCGMAAPAYGYVYDRIDGLSAIYRALPSADGRICRGWRYTRADGSVRQGLGDSVILNYTAEDSGALLEWIWSPDALPEEYLPLDYLRGTGTQYVDTQYNLTSQSRVDIDFTLRSISNAAIPYGSTGDSDQEVHFVYVNESAGEWNAAVGKAYPWPSYAKGAPAVLGHHRFVVNDGGKHVFDGIARELWGEEKPVAFTSPRSAYVFARHDADDVAARTSMMDLHAFDVYEDGELVRSFSPVMRKSDHSAGLYEWVGGTFHPNIGKGAFEPSGGFVRIAGEPNEIGVPTPAYGYASGREAGTEYVCTAPASCKTAQGVGAKCIGWRFTRLDGTTMSGSGTEARFVHTAADDGGTLTWLWRENADLSRGSVRRSALRVRKGAYRGGPLSGFPLLVRVSPEHIAGFAYDQCAAGGGNIWFSDSPEGCTALPCEIDNWNPQGESTFWVRVPTLDAQTRLYMFWGLPPPAVADGSLWGDYAGVWHFNTFANGQFADSTGTGSPLVPKKDGQSFGTDGAVARIGRSKAGIGSLSLADYLTHVAEMNGGKRGTASLSGWFYAPSFANEAGKYYFYPFSAYTSSELKGWCCESTKPCEMHLSGHVHGLLTEVDRQSPDYRSEWMHLAFVSDTALGCWYVYVNGKRFNSPIMRDVLDTEVGQPLEVQGDYLDELRLRSSASSDDWIRAEYLQGAMDDFLAYGDAEVLRAGMLLIFR